VEHCLSPDSNGGIGMDNMTILIVALLQGRTLEQWHDMMVERVENKVGYETPTEYPQVYSAGRLMLASERQRRLRENPSSNLDDDDDDDKPSFRQGPLGGLARILAGHSADVSFIPSSGPRGPPMFADDSSDEDSDDELANWANAEDGSEKFLDHDEDKMLIDDEDMPNHQHFTFRPHTLDKAQHAVDLSGEAPPPPSTSTDKRNQLTGLPIGDSPSAVKADGLLDTSGDPLKSAGAT